MTDEDDKAIRQEETVHTLTVDFVIDEEGQPVLRSAFYGGPPLEVALPVPPEVVSDAIKTLIAVVDAGIDSEPLAKAEQLIKAYDEGSEV